MMRRPIVQEKLLDGKPLATAALLSLIVRHTPKAIIAWILSKATEAMTLEPIPFSTPYPYSLAASMFGTAIEAAVFARAYPSMKHISIGYFTWA